MKKISSFIVATALCMQIFSFKTNAVSSEIKEERIYRTSVQVINEKEGGIFTNTLVAYDTGRIHIEIQKDNSKEFKDDIGYIKFNDTMIAPLNENGKNGKSYVSRSANSVYENSSYDGDNIIYTFINNTYYGATGFYKAYDFYVKEFYMDYTIPMTFFGKEIEIPFGENKYDINTRLDEVEKELYSLKQENALLIEERDALLKENETLKNNFADINLDGKISIADVVLLMRYVNGQIDTIPFIVS